MTTHNTREGIEKLLPCIDPQCDGHGTTITVNRDGEPEQMQCEYCYRERFPILDFIHQELQKAREEGYRDGYQRGQRQGEVNVIGHMIGEYNAPYVYDFNREVPDQSELDQPTV